MKIIQSTQLQKNTFTAMITAAIYKLKRTCFPKCVLLFAVIIVVLVPMNTAFPANKELVVHADSTDNSKSLSPSERDRIAAIHTNRKLGGIEIWIGIAESIRNALRTNKGIAFDSTGSSIDAAKTGQEYLMPTAIAAAIVFVVGIVFLLINFIMWIKCCIGCCCSKVCCRCCRPAKPRATTRRVKIIVAAFLAVISFVYLSSFISGMTGASTVWTGIGNIQGSLLRLGDDVNNQLDNVGPTVETVFVDLRTFLNDTLTGFKRDIDVNSFVTQTETLLTNMVNELYASGQTMDEFKASGQAVADSVASATTSSNDLKSAINDEITKIQALDDPFTGTHGQYELIGSLPFTVPTTESLAPQDFSTLPDIVAYMAPFLPPNTPNLTVKAQEIDTEFGSISTTIPATFESATQPFRVGLDEQYNSLQLSIRNSSDVTTYKSVITDLQDSLTDALDNYIYKNEIAIRYGAMGLFALIGLFTVIVLLGAAVRQPVIVRGSTYPFMFFNVWVCILACLLLLITTIFGDLCYWINEDRRLSLFTSALPKLVGNGSTLANTDELDKYYNLRKDCAANVPILDVLVNAGFVNASTVNITLLTNDLLDQQDFSSMVEGFSFSDALTFGGNISEQLSSFTGNNFTGFNFSAFTAESSKPVTTTSLDDLITELGNFRDGLTVNAFTHDTTVNSEKDDNLASYRAYVTDIITGLTAARDTAQTTIPSQTSVISARVAVMENATVNVQAAVARIIVRYTNTTSIMGGFTGQVKNNVLNVAVPNLKSGFVNFVTSVLQTFNDAFSCRNLALDLYATENSICVYIVGGLDSMWLGLYLVGVLSVIAFPTFFKTASRLAAKLSPDGYGRIHDSGAPSFPKKGSSLGKKTGGKVAPSLASPAPSPAATTKLAPKSQLPPIQISKTAQYEQ